LRSPRFSLPALLAILLAAATGHAAAPLQLFIDLTAPGKTLRLTPGTYAGPAVIDKPMVLDGLNEVTIDGCGKGTVLTIKADGVTVRNCRIVGSGNSHDQVDAAIMVAADEALIENNKLEDVLFGVHISNGNRNILRSNNISSRPTPLSLRGDAVRLWYSRENLIENNGIHGARDMVLTNSPDNIIRGNHITGSRMGMELIYSSGTEVKGNHLDGNEHGIVGIYSDRLRIHHNRIEHQGHLQGSAIAVKASSGTVIENNGILDCAVGLTANSPTYPENILFIGNNTFAYNDVALYFYGEKGGHIIHDNVFFGNFRQVAVTGPTSALANDWSGNMWQDYTGFDRDGDGVGDTPYSVLLYSDRIWMDRPMAKFFRGSPMLEVVDFVERLAPLSRPWLILQDPRPRMADTVPVPGFPFQE
jgi:nitrous oxidase accessory protein